MSDTTGHSITTKHYNVSDNTIVTCICGWWDRWPGNDGSAEQSGAAHLSREARR